MDYDDSRHSHQKRITMSTNEYLQLSDQEKDYAIQQSLTRLQNRIFKIVYLLNEELQSGRDTSADRKIL